MEALGSCPGMNLEGLKDAGRKKNKKTKTITQGASNRLQAALKVWLRVEKK